MDHVQHVAERFAVAAAHAGDVLVRNLEPLLVRVGDLKRDSGRVVDSVGPKVGGAIAISWTRSEALSFVSCSAAPPLDWNTNRN